MHPDSVMHALRAASVAQQSIFAKLSRQQQLNKYDSIIDDTYTVICQHFPDSIVIQDRFLILPSDKSKGSWDTLLMGYDLRTH